MKSKLMNRTLLITVFGALTMAANAQAQNSDSEIRSLLHLDGYNAVPQALIDSARVALPSGNSAAIVGYMEIPTLRQQHAALLAFKQPVVTKRYDKDVQGPDGYTIRKTFSEETPEVVGAHANAVELNALAKRWVTCAAATGLPDLLNEANAVQAAVQLACYNAGIILE